jgi:GT2 family glycosyltransferase
VSSWPRVSVIVASWNGAQDLEECLPSVVRQDYPVFEVIVVDNGSEDDSQDVVKRIGAQWLPLGHNAGLAAALNAGAQVTTGEVLLFLNNDLRLRGDFVRNLARPVVEDPTVFAADALQWDWEGRVPVHGRTRFIARPAWLGCFDLLQDYPTTCVPTFMASAANALVRRWMFEKLGGWDPTYFIGWEDVDLFWRAWQRGWRTVFVPDAVCWHKVAASAATPAGAVNRLRGTLDGRLYFASKCLPTSGALEVWARTCGSLVRDVGTGRWRKAREKAMAIDRAARSLGSALRGRRALYSTGPGPQAHLRALPRLTG